MIQDIANNIETLAHSNYNANWMYRTLAHSKQYNRFLIQTLAYSITSMRDQITAGGEHLPDETPSDRRDIASRTPTQLRLARSHARHEHETKPKPISRLGSAEASFPPTSDTVTPSRCPNQTVDEILVKKCTNNSKYPKSLNLNEKLQKTYFVYLFLFFWL
jgi:hypothetical protein